MKLIERIINELIDTEAPLESPLLKTKVLARRIGHTELENWVQNELDGYENPELIPEYRKSGAQLRGTIINGNRQYNDQPLVIVGLKRELGEFLTSTDFTSSISTLRSMYAKRGPTGELEQVLPAEISHFIEENYRNKIGRNPYLQLISARKIISSDQINEVLNAVRMRLLNFMLDLDEKFGNQTNLEEMAKKESKKEIDQIFNQTITNINTGDGSVVNTGNKAKLKVSIKITKGDKEALIAELKKNGVSEDDIIELAEIIDVDKPNLPEKKFGPKVKNWMKKMLGKAVDGTWEISTGAAGELIAGLIQAYYGF